MDLNVEGHFAAFGDPDTAANIPSGAIKMPSPISLPINFPTAALLPPAPDAAGRTSSFVSLKTATKAWIIAHVNQGNAAQVTISILQAKDSVGTGAKAINATPIWLQANALSSDANISQAAGNAFQTSAALNDKIVIFELLPEQALDLANGFNHVAVQTGPSNAANITEARLQYVPQFQGSTSLTVFQ